LKNEIEQNPSVSDHQENKYSTPSKHIASVATPREIEMTETHPNVCPDEPQKV